MKRELLLSIAIMIAGSYSLLAHADSVYSGTDSAGRPCQVTVRLADYGENSRWQSFMLRSEEGKIDTNVSLPFQSTPTTDGECSVIAGMGKNTVAIDGTVLVQRVRLVEFTKNWIQEAVLSFRDAQLETLSDVEFRVGEKAWSGPLACSALKNNRLQAHFVCANLSKIR